MILRNRVTVMCSRRELDIILEKLTDMRISELLVEYLER